MRISPDSFIFRDTDTRFYLQCRLKYHDLMIIKLVFSPKLVKCYMLLFAQSK